MAEGASVNITASGIVLTSGKPVRVFGLRFVSGSGGVGTVTVYNGTSASGTLKAQISGTISGNTSITFGAGIKCVGGLYVSLDANVTSCDIDVLQEQST